MTRPVLVWIGFLLGTAFWAGAALTNREYSKVHAEAEAEGWKALPKMERERLIRERREKAIADQQALEARGAQLARQMALASVTPTLPPSLDERLVAALERMAAAQEAQVHATVQLCRGTCQHFDCREICGQ